MPPVRTESASKPARAEERAQPDLRALEKVRAIFACLSKYISAKTIYASNNPNVSNFANAFHGALRAYFETEKELLLAIEQYRITWRQEVVYQNDQKTDSIAFLLYKDGVGEITIQSSVKPAELEQFVDLLRNEIYAPSAHLDVVGRLWQAEFASIFYRVFDESTDGAAGEGKGTGMDNKEEPMLVNDHPGLPSDENNSRGDNTSSDPTLESVGAYFQGLVEHMHPQATALEKEQRLQDLLEFYFILSGEELESCRERFAATDEREKLLRLLEAMLDFTRMESPPPVVRDILDIIERFVRHVVEDLHVPTLIALLGIQKRLSESNALALDFQDLPSRIEYELTNAAFLLSLGKVAPRSSIEAEQALEYFQLVGKNAVPGLCEFLANSKDPSMHKRACDALIAIAGDETPTVVNALNLDNPHEAKDAIYLLRHFVTAEIPPVVHTLMSSPDIQVREHAIVYLASVGTDEAARLLCGCLEGEDVNIRVKTLAAVEDFRHPLIVDKVTAMCFAEDAVTRSGDELERMFRAVGKLAGGGVLASLRQMTKTKTWMPFGKTRAKQHKLLAITALRYIPGREASDMLTELANDGDSLVRTKAQYVMKQRAMHAGSGVDDAPPAAEESAAQ